MGMHVRRHGWRHFAPPLSFGLALSVKMNSDLVVDAISSQDIGQLRDESVLDLSTSYQLSSGLQVSAISPTNRCECIVTTNRTASAATTSTAAVISST